MSSPDSTISSELDQEKQSQDVDVPVVEEQQRDGLLHKIKTAIYDVESQSIVPLTDSERNETASPSDNFTLWLSMNATIACFSLGTLAPLLFGLSLRDSSLIIIFFNMFSCFIPSYLATFGPKLGLRTMVFARYSFGYYVASFPAFLNLATFIGFTAVNAIVGGQTLAVIQGDSLSPNVGIVIIAIVSLVISFSGYRALHAIERYTYIPITLSFIILCGYSGSALKSAMNFESIPATAGTVLSFAALVVGFTISWSGACLDFCTYFPASISATKVVAYTFAGLYTPCVLLQICGAAFACAALSGEVDGWSDAFTNNSVGGLLGVALLPMGGFGSFLLVLLALGIIANNAPTVYAFSISIYVAFPFLSRFPRTVFPVLATIIYIPIAIVGNQSFSTALSFFVGVISYWSAIFATILLVEHFVFREGKFSSYDIAEWNDPSRLPKGFAAAFAFACGAGAVAVGMDQVFYRGPLAIAIAGGPDSVIGGDIAFELAMLVSAITYYGARRMEKRMFV